jgi:hypothetical protein
MVGKLEKIFTILNQQFNFQLVKLNKNISDSYFI